MKSILNQFHLDVSQNLKLLISVRNTKPKEINKNISFLWMILNYSTLSFVIMSVKSLLERNKGQCYFTVQAMDAEQFNIGIHPLMTESFPC